MLRSRVVGRVLLALSLALSVVVTLIFANISLIFIIQALSGHTILIGPFTQALLFTVIGATLFVWTWRLAQGGAALRAMFRAKPVEPLVYETRANPSSIWDAQAWMGRREAAVLALYEHAVAHPVPREWLETHAVLKLLQLENNEGSLLLDELIVAGAVRVRLDEGRVLYDLSEEELERVLQLGSPYHQQIRGA